MNSLEIKAGLDRILNYCRINNRTVRVADLLKRGIPMHDIRLAVKRHNAGYYPDSDTYTIISFRVVRTLINRTI
jgi:hypothetical protein